MKKRNYYVIIRCYDLGEFIEVILKLLVFINLGSHTG